MSTRIIGTAHQRIIRDKKAAEQAANSAWLKSVNRDISNMVVREIDRETCKKVILEYEWLGCMPAVVWKMYGAFYDGQVAGVVCYGPEYSENLGIQARKAGRKCADWSKYGYEGKMILLSRGACVHWAHPHTGSKLIRRSMDMLPKKYEVVTSTTDEAAGEIGTIYQACGFYYVGSMRENNPNVKSRRMDRDAWLINGKIVGTRSIRAKLGNCKSASVLAVWPHAQKIKQHSKHRYFAFRGSRGTQKRHHLAILGIIKPYPKRGGGIKSDTSVFHTEGHSDDPVTPLHFVKAAEEALDYCP